MSKHSSNGMPHRSGRSVRHSTGRSTQSSVGNLNRPRRKQEQISMGEIDDHTSGLAAIAAANLHSAAARGSSSDNGTRTRMNHSRSQNRPAGRQQPSGIPRRKSKTHDLKATAAPLLGTVGILLLVPALWSVLVLMGWSVPGAAREDSRPMAAVMLVSWPIAICLLAAAFVFFMQLRREKKRAARTIGPRNGLP